jgi:hypothetical protein
MLIVSVFNVGVMRKATQPVKYATSLINLDTPLLLLLPLMIPLLISVKIGAMVFT